uniref:CDP-diacylglycerol--glycerol-3-phosphate 3-phosphatidyltransferase n=1 Tax=Panagrolaimus sp. JU765 TaxID=591449 RepID=A0AC34PW21_9BILA
MDWLVEDRPSLPVNPENVHFIKTPTEFYETIIARIRTAKKRIILASLYLGTSELESKLIEELKNALETNPELELCVLLDYLRGTRGGSEKSSATMLQTLADRGRVFFYHTPDLRGMVKNMLPARMNEIIGLQHMKFYAFDDSVIISGANLSDSYFVNRQDRYVMIENNPDLVRFFTNVFEAVASSSFQLRSDGTLELHSECDFHPFEGDRRAYLTDISSKIKLIMDQLRETCDRRAYLTDISSKIKLIMDQLRETCGKLPKTDDTLLYPFLQFGPFGINDEVKMLSNLFSKNHPELELTVATGYFNPYDAYLDMILKKSNYSMKFLYAAPDANGFFNAEGLSGYVPAFLPRLGKSSFAGDFK